MWICHTPEMQNFKAIPTVNVAFTPEEKPKKKSTNGGYCLTSRPSPPSCKLTDDQIREARWLREYRGWKVSVLADRYNVSGANMRNVLDYVTRGKISVSQASFTDSMIS